MQLSQNVSEKSYKRVNRENREREEREKKDICTGKRIQNLFIVIDRIGNDKSTLSCDFKSPFHFTRCRVESRRGPFSYRACIFELLPPPTSSSNNPSLSSVVKQEQYEMPSSLGKRTRSSDSSMIDFSSTLNLPNPLRPASDPTVSRVKRRARGEIFNDENENPFITQISGDENQDGDSMDLDELSEAVPSKHGIAEKRILLSPSKAKYNFNTNGTLYS